MGSTLTTGATGTGNPVSKPPSSPVYRVIQRLSRMSARSRWFLAGAMAVILSAAIIVSVQSAKNTKVALFEGRKITAFEVQKMCLELQRQGIDVETDGSGANLMVFPADKGKAKMTLAVAGYPEVPVLTEKDPENGWLKTEREKEVLLLRRLQGDLTLAIQSLEGVRGAVVQIAIPERSPFEVEKQKTKAAVMVMMQPGHSFAPEQVKGIMHLVASSVAGLEANQVQVLDERGRLLSDMISIGDDVFLPGGSGLPRTLVSRKAEEKHLEEKLQAVLDRALGPGKAVASVSIDLDFSHVRTESRSFGGPTNIKGTVTEAKHVEKESLTRDGDRRREGPGTWTGDENRKDRFLRESIRERIKVNETTVTRTNAPGEVKRLAVAVLVDGLKDDQVSSIRSIAKDVVGADEARGDSITVRSIPFDEDVFAVMRNNLWKKVENQTSNPKALNEAWAWRLLMIPVLLAVMCTSLFLYNQRKGRQEKARLFLGTGAYGPMQEISDLLTDRTVKASTSQNPVGRLRASEDLEYLARQKPTRVAELLKTRYLADMK